MWEKIRTFMSEVVSELKKVSWPSRRETVNLTVVVIGLIFILAIFLGVVDYVLARVISIIIR